MRGTCGAPYPEENYKWRRPLSGFLGWRCRLIEQQVSTFDAYCLWNMSLVYLMRYSGCRRRINVVEPSANGSQDLDAEDGKGGLI